MKPTLDENGRLMLREDYRIATLNCGDEDFAVACMRSNLRYGKNQKREDVKSHHYIISFDPRDAVDNGLTVDRAQALGEEFCRKQFPGHQAIVCTHPDGHNHSGNIHVHIVINTQHFGRSGHCRGHLGLHGLYCVALLLSVQDRQHQQIRVRCPLRKERLNGVCDRSQRFDPCKIQSLIRADQAAAGLLRRCAFNGRTALFFGPELSFQQCSGPADDFCHAAGAAVRSVRAARPAP